MVEKEEKMCLVEDVMIKILSRLSMKTLLRCRSVCKSWKALIASPYFINTHLNFSRNNTPQLLFRTCVLNLEDRERHFFPNADCTEDDRKDRKAYLETYLSYCDNNEPIDLHNKFDAPFAARHGCFGVLTCNGLICLTVGSKHDIPVILWNPLINKAVYIPEPIYKNDSYKPQLGFGYDIVTNDYKLVRFTRTPKVEVYRLSTRIWEDITGLALYDTYAYAKSVNLHGAAHWFAIKDGIILFDMHSEVFRKIRFISSLEKKVMWPFSTLVTGQGLLYMVNGNFKSGTPIWKYDIWVMKEYGVVESWVMQFSVDLDYKFVPRCFMNNGEMLWEDDDTLNSYDPKSKQFKDLLSSNYPYYVGHYVPSLVLNDLKVDCSDSDKFVLGLKVEHIKENLDV